MKVAYIVEYSLLDTLKRIRKTVHVGVFDDLSTLPALKRTVARDNPHHTVVFAIYSHLHPFHNVKIDLDQLLASADKPQRQPVAAPASRPSRTF